MKKLTLATIAALGTLGLAACDKQGSETAQNTAQEPQVSFEAADANGDGHITGQEALAVPNLDFARMDTDRNQSVTRQEFATAMALARPRG